MKKGKSMKSFAVTGICGTSVLAAAMVFAQAEAPKTINVVGLENDSENAKVVVSNGLEAVRKVHPPKPVAAVQPAVSLSADAIDSASQATTAPQISANDLASTKLADEPKNVKALVTEGTVIPPSAEQAKTVEDAIRWILRDAKKQAATVSSNGIEQLTMPYQQIGDGKSYETEWRKAIRHLLSPFGYNFTEDGDLVLFGRSDEVDAKHKILQQEQLIGNRTPIVFTTSGDGMELRNAIHDIALKAGVTITTDYMEPADLYVPVAANAEVGQISAADIGKANDKANQQRVQVKRTSFNTNGQSMEWRIVLREVLQPNGYEFVEIGGVVRVAKPAKIAEWEKAKDMAKPLSARVVKVYHADPESVVERVMKLKILKHPNAQIQAVAKKEDRAEIFRGSQSGVTVASGTRMGASSIGNSSAFSSLRRPKIPPAIVIYDLEENLDAVEEKIRLFDIRERQVLIEAIIFDVTDGNGEKGDMTGINWGEALNNLQLAEAAYNGGLSWYDGRQTVRAIDTISEKLAKDNSVLNNALESTFLDEHKVDEEGHRIPPERTRKTTGSYNGEFGRTRGRTETDRYDKNYTKKYGSVNEINVTFGPINFQMVIDLILERKDSRLLSNPMVVIGDHSESVIQVGDATPIPMTRSTVVASGGNVPYENRDTEWQILMTGIMLWVSPEITADGKSVRLSVHPQITTPKKPYVKDPQTGAETYPEVSSQELDTRVTIKSGDSLLLGGLISSSDADQESRVWLLADIPWIGRIFRWNTKILARRNLMMLIRPTILDDDAPESGYEKPTLKYTDKLSANMGKNLKLYKPELDDTMTIGENKIGAAIGLKKKEEEKTETEVKPVEPVEPVQENKQ